MMTTVIIIFTIYNTELSPSSAAATVHSKTKTKNTSKLTEFLVMLFLLIADFGDAKSFIPYCIQHFT